MLTNFRETSGPWSIRFGCQHAAKAYWEGIIQFLLHICQCSWRPSHKPDCPSTEIGGQCCRCYEFLQLWVSTQTPGTTSQTLQRPCALARVRDMLTDQHSSGSVCPGSCLCGFSMNDPRFNFLFPFFLFPFFRTFDTTLAAGGRRLTTAPNHRGSRELL